MKTFYSICFFCFYLLTSGQTYSYQQVKDSSLSILENQVGQRLVKYFEFSPQSIYITYESWLGRTKTEWIEPDEKFKIKRLMGVSLSLVLKHSSLVSSNYYASFFMDLDKNLSSKDSFDIFEIPEFIRDGRAIDWLTDQEKNEIIDTLSFEKTVTQLLSSIIYDQVSKQIFFEIKGRYDSKNGSYYFENYWINIVTGRVEKHFYTEHYVCSRI